jgi:hypothetical protein
MNRKDFFSRSWIPVRDLIPPDDPTQKKQVLVYIYRHRYVSSMPQWLAHIDAQRLIKQWEDDLPFTDFAWDRVFSHWMPVSPPIIEGDNS